jgi:hypothetical protein
MKKQDKPRKFLDAATIEGWYKVEKFYGNTLEWLRRERKKDENVLIPIVESSEEVCH